MKGSGNWFFETSPVREQIDAANRRAYLRTPEGQARHAEAIKHAEGLVEYLKAELMEASAPKENGHGHSKCN